jgi:hypothetical protein
MPQQNAIERHVEKLDKVYVCNNFRVVFLFRSEVDDGAHADERAAIGRPADCMNTMMIMLSLIFYTCKKL